MKRLLSVAAAAAALLCAFPSPASAQLQEGVVAVVNDDIISTFDVRQRALLLLAQNQIPATDENLRLAAQQAVQELINERLQMQEAREFNITVSPDTIDRQLAEMARGSQLSVEQFTQALAGAGIGLGTLRAQIEAEFAWRRLINGRYGSRVRISEQRIRETQQRIASSATRTQYNASEIFLPAASPQEFQEAEQLAMRLMQEMSNGAPFPLVARRFSAAPSAAQGGDLGWMASGELRPEIQTVLDRLQPNEVSTPFRTESGIYIVALRAKRDGSAAQTVERVTLRQIYVPAANQAELDRARRRFDSCQNMEPALRGLANAEIVDLGQAVVSELSQTVRDQISGLTAGQSTPVSVAGERASTMVVCARESNTTGVPSREEIEGRLFEQELALLAQRYLRNLRREATIDQPQHQ